MQELEALQHLIVNARVIARNLLIIKHLSEKLKIQYNEVITKFATDFGKWVMTMKMMITLTIQKKNNNKTIP